MSTDDIRFCPHCGVAVIHKPYGGQVRPACPQCDWVYFPDPKVAAAVLVIHEGRLLLVRRRYKPHAGKWTLPAGFVDAFEDPQVAATRECREETGLHVRITGLLDVLAGREHPRGADMMIVYCAEVHGGELFADDDADAAAFFDPDHLPELAFQSTRLSVEKWMKKAPCTTEAGTEGSTEVENQETSISR